MTELDIVFDPLPAETLTRFVSDALDLHGVAATGIAEYYPANFFLKSPRGEWLGGLIGTIWGGWLHVRYLWIAAAVRGQGHGARLLQAAECYAVERGCVAATLETFSYEARPFYEKQGYEVFGMLTGYPPGHAKFYLRKHFVQPETARDL